MTISAKAAHRLGPGVRDRELSLDILAKIVAATGAPSTERPPDEQVLAALVVEAPVAATAVQPAPAAPDGEVKLAPAKTGFDFEKLGKFTERKDDPLYEKTFYQKAVGSPAEKPASDKPATEKAAPEASAPAKKLPTSAEVRGVYVLHDTGQKVLAKSQDGKSQVTISSQTNAYASGGGTDKDGAHAQVKVGLDHVTQVKAIAKLSAGVIAEGKVEVKGEVGIVSDIGQGAFKAKVGAEVVVEGKVEGTHKLAGGKDVAGSASVNAKATGELSIGISKDGLKAKGDLGATAGAGLGGAVKQAGHTVGTYVGVEAGVGAAVSASAGITDGKIKISIDAKLSAGVGAKIKTDLEYDTRWIAKTAANLVAEAKDPNSALSQALADGKDSKVQQASLYLTSAGKHLTDQGVHQGKFFGAPVKTVGDIVGAVGTLGDRTVTGGEKAVTATQAVLNTLGFDNVNVAETVYKIKHGTAGEKAKAIAEVGGKIVLKPFNDRVDAVKEAIDTFKSDGVVSGLVASGKALLKIVPCGGSVLKVIAKLF